LFCFRFKRRKIRQFSVLITCKDTPSAWLCYTFFVKVVHPVFAFWCYASRLVRSTPKDDRIHMSHIPIIVIIADEWNLKCWIKTGHFHRSVCVPIIAIIFITIAVPTTKIIIGIWKFGFARRLAKCKLSIDNSFGPVGTRQGFATPTR